MRTAKEIAEEIVFGWRVSLGTSIVPLITKAIQAERDRAAVLVKALEAADLRFTAMSESTVEYGAPKAQELIMSLNEAQTKTEQALATYQKAEEQNESIP